MKSLFKLFCGRIHFLNPECNTTLHVEHGVVTYNGTAVGDRASFTCYEGYERIGDINTVCLSSLTWETYNVSCSIVGIYFCIFVCKNIKFIIYYSILHSQNINKGILRLKKPKYINMIGKTVSQC